MGREAHIAKKNLDISAIRYNTGMPWQAFAALVAAGTVGYETGAKLTSGKISPLLGVFIATTCSLILFGTFVLIYRALGFELSFNKSGLWAAALAGVSIAIADISLFIMFTRGAQLSVGGVVVEVLTILFLALIGILFLKEPLSFQKALGLLFSLAGIVFLIRG